MAAQDERRRPDEEREEDEARRDAAACWTMIKGRERGELEREQGYRGGRADRGRREEGSEKEKLGCQMRLK